jgi:CheY-like chemotaxis protein
LLDLAVGAGAVERFRAGGLDGVLLDVDMPGMDGRAVLLTVLAGRCRGSR